MRGKQATPHPIVFRALLFLTSNVFRLTSYLGVTADSLFSDQTGIPNVNVAL